MNRLALLVSIALLLAAPAAAAFAQLPTDLKNSDLGPDVPPMRVRPGYRVTRAVPPKQFKDEARFLEFSDDGKTLFVSFRDPGYILALRDPDADGLFKTINTFVKDRRSVQGMDFHNGWLYFSQASEGSVSRARDTNGDGVADDVEYVLPAGSVPKGGGHPFEGLLVTDTTIYLTCSDPTNMTPELDSPRKTIYAFDADGKNKRVFSHGVRNVEKLRFRPGTQEIWGFDHGSDNFGARYGEKTGKDQPITDLLPPEEFNRFVEGGFYGHPYFSANRLPRPEFADRKDFIELANKTIPPEWNVPAHWAVLGFTFVEKDHFGGDHQGDVFYAAHGSWNSIKPVGACVQRILFDDVTGRPYGSLTIVDCQGEGRRRHARPVDCAEAPDGTIIWSSDEPPALYRLSRSSGGGGGGTRTSSAPPTSQPAAPEARPAQAEAIDVERFKQIAAEGGDKVVVLDVRTPEEFAEARIAGAVNLDVQDPQFAEKLAKLDRDKTYLVYCRSGRRSANACGIMNDQKFPAGRQYNLRGGIVAWKQAGNQVETGK